MNATGLRRWLVAGPLGLVSLASPSPASAHGPPGEVAAVLLTIVVVDATFTVVDFVAFADDSRSNAWVIPQAILATPQAILFGGATHHDTDVPVGLCIAMNQLTAFALYGLASPRVSTSALYGLSWGIGANTALTNKAVALALHGEFPSRAMAITELVSSVPQIAVAGYALRTPDEFPRQRAAVLALGAWSSALFVHGALSLAFYRPKPEPKAAPTPQHTWRLTPGVVSSDLAFAPGLVALGQF